MTPASLFAEHYATVCRAVASYPDGEDAAAFAFLQVVRGKMPPDCEKPRAWLVTVARNRAAAQATRKRPCEPLTPEIAASAADPETATLARERLASLNACKPAEYTALFMFAAGFSYDEIGAANGHARTWANRYVTEGRQRLRAIGA